MRDLLSRVGQAQDLKGLIAVSGGQGAILNACLNTINASRAALRDVIK